MAASRAHVPTEQDLRAAAFLLATRQQAEASRRMRLRIVGLRRLKLNRTKPR